MGKKVLEMNIRELEKALPPEKLTPDVTAWFDEVDRKQSEEIEDGLILEFSDLMNHPTDPDIWQRFINSLSYLTKFETYHKRIIANINLIQQLELHITRKLDGAAAVSLISPTDLISRNHKINIKAKPKLLINPLVLFHMMIVAGHSPAKPDDIYKHLLGILIHETYHITRGDLLFEQRFHYASKTKAEEYKTALHAEPIEFLGKDGNSTFKTEQLHQFNNIMMDLSINEDIRKIDKHLMPYMEDAKVVMAATTQKYLEDVLNQTDSRPDVDFKPASHFNINSLNDFYSEEVALRDKQYAIFEYHRSKISDDDMQSAANDLASGAGAGDGQTPGTNNAGSGLANQGAPNTDDVIGQNAQAAGNMSEDQMDDAVAGIDNLMQVANAEAAEDTGGKAYSLEPSQGLRQKILDLKKAKPLPRFKVAFEGLIKDINRKTKLNFHMRHIAQPKRMDMARRQKLVVEGGMHVYMDVSGSVSDKVIQDVYNVMMATVKSEPVLLYLFASDMSVTPLTITTKTRLDDVKNFIQNEDVGFGTTFTHLFENIKEHQKQKHAIFSDFCFDESEFNEYREEFKRTPIIYIAEYMKMFTNTQLYQYAISNPKYNFVLSLNDYTLE